MDRFFDVETLKCMKTEMDKLIDPIRYENHKKIQKFLTPTFHNLNDVTNDIVTEFQNEARSHVQYLLHNGYKLKTLYWLHDNIEMFNKMEIDYQNFFLINQRNIISNIEQMVTKYFFSKKKDLLKFQITCLYLLYFYALLVNEDCTWILIDYLNVGNKHHQYFIERV